MFCYYLGTVKTFIGGLFVYLFTALQSFTINDDYVKYLDSHIHISVLKTDTHHYALYACANCMGYMYLLVIVVDR